MFPLLPLVFQRALENGGVVRRGLPPPGRREPTGQGACAAQPRGGASRALRGCGGSAAECRGRGGAVGNAFTRMLLRDSATKRMRKDALRPPAWYHGCVFGGLMDPKKNHRRMQNGTCEPRRRHARPWRRGAWRRLRRGVRDIRTGRKLEPGPAQGPPRTAVDDGIAEPP